MPLYRYQAIDGQGQVIKGAMAAENEDILDRKLKSAGLWILQTAIEASGSKTDAPAARKSKGLPMGGKAKRRALINFCTMMTFMSKASIPLVNALEMVAQQNEQPQAAEILMGVKKSMEEGNRLYESMAKYPKFFPPEFIGVIRAGEMSGKLTEAFKDLKKYMEWVDQVIKDVAQATLYPLIVTCVISAFTLALFTFIVPKFMSLLTGLKIPLPMPTIIIFGISNVIKSTWFVWLSGLLFMTVGLHFGRKHSPRFARFVDAVKLKLPLFGEVNLLLALSRFANNFVVLYRAGISVPQTLEMCQGLVGNQIVSEAITKLRKDVNQGDTIAEAMKKSPIFPPMMLRMVMLGESTGTLDNSLADLAGFWGDQVPSKIKKILTVLEPMLMLFLIGVVGMVAMAIYMPLVSMMSNLK